MSSQISANTASDPHATPSGSRKVVNLDATVDFVSYDPIYPNSAQLTQIEYAGFQDAYNHFNRALFGGELPQCLITLQRKGKNNHGYFSPLRFRSRKTTDVYTDEIALNPDMFSQVDDREIMQTLTHEMVHLWQHHFGKSSRGGYHNKEWAQKMEDIGLMPSSTGKPGGRKTGETDAGLSSGGRGIRNGLRGFSGTVQAELGIATARRCSSYP